jgi:type IV pilus biogenesis protein CpaD/CtpE
MAVKWFSNVLKGLLILPFLSLMACETYDETRFVQQRTQVHSEPITLEIPVDKLSDEYLHSIVSDFSSHGVGSASVVVGYDSNADSNGSKVATSDLSKITEVFNSYHAVNFETAILPIKDNGNVNKVMISYLRTYAKAPENCRVLPHGYHGDTETLDNKYEFGCYTEMLMAKQAARPSDLAGKEDTMGLHSGSRLGNKTAAYQVGAEMGMLGGQTTQ